MKNPNKQINSINLGWAEIVPELVVDELLIVKEAAQNMAFNGQN